MGRTFQKWAQARAIISHNLIRGILIQSCSTGAVKFPNYVFCHTQCYKIATNNLDNFGLDHWQNFQLYGPFSKYRGRAKGSDPSILSKPISVQRLRIPTYIIGWSLCMYDALKIGFLVLAVHNLFRKLNMPSIAYIIIIF